MKNSPLKVLYLFNRVRIGIPEQISAGKDHDGHFFGMYRLRTLGIETDYLEPEQFWPKWITALVRERILNIHYIHAPFFFRMRRYDVVFTSTAFGSLFIKTVLGLHRPKWVIFDFGLEGMMGYNRPHARRTFRQKMLEFMVSRADGIVTLSPGEAEKMQNRFPHLKDRIVHLALGVDTRFFTPSTVQEKNIILSPGRDPGRDIRTLIKATEDMLTGNGQKIEVDITSRSRNLTKLGLDILPQHVRRLDLSPLAMRDAYAEASIVVIPLMLDSGVNDAMGCSTLVEAMAMGKAIIATDTETMRAYITHGVNGVLVPEKDVTALREAIFALLSNPKKRAELGRAARVFAETYLSAEHFARNLGEFIKRIAEK